MAGKRVSRRRFAAAAAALAAPFVDAGRWPVFAASAAGHSGANCRAATGEHFRRVPGDAWITT